jgi:DNA-binding response OmpR family regulator
MVVEDECLIATLVHESLERGGFNVMTLRNGAEAWRMLDQAGPPPVLVTDINAGEGPNGWEIARYARDRRPDIAVVYMTGAAAHEWPIHGVSQSIMVPKPFAPSAIILAVSKLLRESGLGRSGSSPL